MKRLPFKLPRCEQNSCHELIQPLHGGLQQGGRDGGGGWEESFARRHGFVIERRAPARALARPLLPYTLSCWTISDRVYLGFRPHGVCLQTQWNDKDLDALLNESDDDEPARARYAEHPRSPSAHACWFMNICALSQRGARAQEQRRRRPAIQPPCRGELTALEVLGFRV